MYSFFCWSSCETICFVINVFRQCLHFILFRSFVIMQLNESGIALLKNYFSTSPVLKAYLFGSVARHEGDDQSDVDILVDLDYSQRIGLKFIQMKLDLEKMLNQKVDLVSSKGLSPYMTQKIDSEKQLIYAR